jgi:hypothetical protein
LKSRSKRPFDFDFKTLPKVTFGRFLKSRSNPPFDLDFKSMSKVAFLLLLLPPHPSSSSLLSLRSLPQAPTFTKKQCQNNEKLAQIPADANRRRQ